jgi:hypothetical protein
MASYQNRTSGHAWFNFTANGVINLSDAAAPTQSFTATVSSSCNQITAVSNTTGINVGQAIYCVSGTTLSTGTVVSAVNTVSNVITMSSTYGGSPGTGVSFVTSLEGVTNLSITKIISSGVWQIYRNSTLVWQTSNTNSVFDFSSLGTALSQNSTFNIVANNQGAGISTLLIQVSKQAFANGGGAGY